MMMDFHKELKNIRKLKQAEEVLEEFLTEVIEKLGKLSYKEFLKIKELSFNADSSGLAAMICDNSTIILSKDIKTEQTPQELLVILQEKLKREGLNTHISHFCSKGYCSCVVQLPED